MVEFILKDGDDDDDEEDEEAMLERPYLFYVGEEEVKSSIRECFKRVLVNRERTLPVIYKPQAMFRWDTEMVTQYGL